MLGDMVESDDSYMAEKGGKLERRRMCDNLFRSRRLWAYFP